MARPVTLFTGQWADLPLDDLAAKASQWGFDGLELACWGDHFEVDRAVADAGYAKTKREQLARAETALDRERAEQHKTVSLLHDLITSRPAAPAGNGGQHPHADGSTGHQPADTAGNGTSRRQAPR